MTQVNNFTSLTLNNQLRFIQQSFPNINEIYTYTFPRVKIGYLGFKQTNYSRINFF